MVPDNIFPPAVLPPLSFQMWCYAAIDAETIFQPQSRRNVWHTVLHHLQFCPHRWQNPTLKQLNSMVFSIQGTCHTMLYEPWNGMGHCFGCTHNILCTGSTTGLTPWSWTHKPSTVWHRACCICLLYISLNSQYLGSQAQDMSAYSLLYLYTNMMIRLIAMIIYMHDRYGTNMMHPTWRT